MRRRRNADAPITDATSETAAPTNDSEPSQISPAEEAPAAAVAENSVEEQPQVDIASAEAETPKPARKRSTAPRKKKGTEPAAASPAELAEATAVAEPETADALVTADLDPAPAEAAEQISETPSSEAEPATAGDEASKPKRSPRRRRMSAAASNAEAQALSAEPPAFVPAEPAPETAAVVDSATDADPAVVPSLANVPSSETPQIGGANPPARRRGNLRRRAAASATETQISGEPAAEADTTATEPINPAGTEASTEVVGAASSTDETRNRRNRGGRRRRTPADSAATTDAATAEGGVSPVADDASVAGSTAGAAAADAAERRRTRGPRRTAAPGRAEAAATGAAAPEPLLPAYQPLPDDVLARLAETRVVVRKNIPDLVIDGEPRIPMWFFVNTEEALYGAGSEPGTGPISEARDVAQRQIRLAYDAGIRVFTVLAHLPWRMRSGERRFGPLDDALAFVTENAPDAFILPRLIFSPPASWERTHADQMTRYTDGETGDVSIASRAFWEGEADEALRAAVEHVAQGPYAARVFGFYLEHGEWFYEKGRGYDVSEANVAGFRAWLRARYKNSLVGLRAAWYDGSVTFDTAEIPAPATAFVPGSPLFFSDREQRYVDFHEYSSDIVAQVITRLGKAVKEASGSRSAVAVSYGYTLELPRSCSGHLALAQVLASPMVDILTGPVSYSGRTPGGSAPLAAPIDSIILAGKLWVSEDDTKSFLAHNDTPDVYNTKVSSFEGTWAAYSRNFGAALARGGGISFMDLWGMGWLDDRELWQRIGKLRAIAESLATRRRNPRTRPAPDPDVAVIIDERSFFDVRADESMLSHLISHQRDSLLRSGARVGFYLMSDLLKKNFPSGPRLLIFLNAFRLNDAARAVIRERFQDDGRTLAWMYGPGCRETNVSELTDVIGMQLRMQPWGSKTGTQVLSNGRSPLTDNLRGQRLGEEVRANPSFYVADPKAALLGEYTINGNASIGYRKHARWQSVFIGEMTLPIPLLRGLYRLAGVPVYTVDDDVAVIGDCLISLHSAPGGGTIVYLPEEGVLYDLLTDETLATEGWGARLSMPPRGTRLLFWGAAAEISRLGGDPKAGSAGLLQADRPSVPTPFVFDSSESRVVLPQGSLAPSYEVSEEDDALMQAALLGEIPGIPEDVDADDAADIAPVVGFDATIVLPSTEAETAEEAARKKRKRRRRRGRGRGAADGESESDGTEIAGELPESDDDAESDEANLEDAATTGILGSELPEGDSSDSATAFTGSAVRGRPSLQELLPDSEFAEGIDLPPIPDEFLPLNEREFTAEIAAPLPEAEGTATRRRRRGSGGGGGSSRGRGSNASNASDSAGLEAADATMPDANVDGETTPGK